MSITNCYMSVLLLALLLVFPGCGPSPLMTAAYRGNRDLVHSLLEQGVDVNQKLNGYGPFFGGTTALGMAIDAGDAVIVRMLLKGGADTGGIYTWGSITSKRSGTLADYAAEKGYSDIESLLRGGGGGGTPVALAQVARPKPSARVVPRASRSSVASSWPDLSQASEGRADGSKDAALIVGVEAYPFVAPIPGAVGNATDWYSYLVRTAKVPVERVTLLRNNEATLEKMRKFAKQAAGEVKPGGTLWFIFIGHGAADKAGKDGLLVGVDAQNDPDGLYARSLPRNELTAILGKGRQDKTVILLDACFSGKTSDGNPLIAGLQPLVLVQSATESQDPKTVLLTAARSDQFAGPLPGADRPAFSYLALGGMRGWADEDSDGEVTAKEIVGYANKALRVLVKGRNQTPELASGIPGQALGGGREQGPDLAAMLLNETPRDSGRSTSVQSEDDRLDEAPYQPTQRRKPEAGSRR